MPNIIRFGDGGKEGVKSESGSVTFGGEGTYRYITFDNLDRIDAAKISIPLGYGGYKIVLKGETFESGTTSAYIPYFEGNTLRIMAVSNGSYTYSYTVWQIG